MYTHPPLILVGWENSHLRRPCTGGLGAEPVLAIQPFLQAGAHLIGGYGYVDLVQVGVALLDADSGLADVLDHLSVVCGRRIRSVGDP